MVEPLDVFDDGELDVVDGSPGSAVADQLGLAEGVDGLGEGVVPAVAPRADRGNRVGLGGPLTVCTWMLTSTTSSASNPSQTVRCRNTC